MVELMELKRNRLKDEVEFYGVYWQGKLIAGSMVPCFGKRVFHIQYLASDSDYSWLYPMNFLNYHMIHIAKEREFVEVCAQHHLHDGYWRERCECGTEVLCTVIVKG